MYISTNSNFWNLCRWSQDLSYNLHWGTGFLFRGMLQNISKKGQKFQNLRFLIDVHKTFIYLFTHRFFYTKNRFKHFVASLCHSCKNSGCHVFVMSDGERISVSKFSSCITVWKRNCHTLHIYIYIYIYIIKWILPLLCTFWIVRRTDKIPRCWPSDFFC